MDFPHKVRNIFIIGLHPPLPPAIDDVAAPATRVVAHVEPCDVHAGGGERLQLIRPYRGGANGAYEFGVESILPELGLDDGIDLNRGGGVVGRRGEDDARGGVVGGEDDRGGLIGTGGGGFDGEGREGASHLKLLDFFSDHLDSSTLKSHLVQARALPFAGLRLRSELQSLINRRGAHGGVKNDWGSQVEIQKLPRLHPTQFCNFCRNIRELAFRFGGATDIC